MKKTPPRRHQPQQRSWVEILCLGCTCLQLIWAKVVMRKWLNISTKDSDYSADTTDDDDDNDSDSDNGEFCEWPRRSRFRDDGGKQGLLDDALPRLRRPRRKSETFRAQYINKKEIKICVATWNIGGKLPPDDLDIEGWLDISEPADVYVIGLQEIIPLNAGNIFGVEDSRPVLMWENIIRETLNKMQNEKTTLKCYSDPPSPSRFRPSEEAPDIQDEIVLETDSDVEEESHPINEECIGYDEMGEGPNKVGNKFVCAEALVSSENTKVVRSDEQDLQRQLSPPKMLENLDRFRTEYREENLESFVFQNNRMLTKTLSGTEKIGLSWPDPPLDLLGRLVLDRPNSFKCVKSFKTTKSFRTHNSFTLSMNSNNKVWPDAAFLTELDLKSLLYRKRRPPFVRIVSKQMVGIFLTIWVRRSLRKHVQNLNVSTVGVGVMGYIGNKGSISVSMSIYQTLFCFICSHLKSGEKDGDTVKRNADVHEIYRRTHFNSLSSIGLPKTICDHERIVWLGDLNYRINLSYEKTRELIDKKEWSKLAESDQLIRELRKGRVFDGWSEGALNFPPTYKYEINSEKYYGEDPRVGRRTPAWCDRILSFGKGFRLLNYRRTELRLSDHRPVTASYMVEVEVFSPRKLQRALTFTAGEIDEEEILTEMGIDGRMSHLRFQEKDGGSVYQQMRYLPMQDACDFER